MRLHLRRPICAISLRSRK